MGGGRDRGGERERGERERGRGRERERGGGGGRGWKKEIKKNSVKRKMSRKGIQ